MQQNLEIYKEQVLNYIKSLPYVTILDKLPENTDLFVNAVSQELSDEAVTDTLMSALCEKIDIYFRENYLNENNIEIIIVSPDNIKVFISYENGKRFLNITFLPLIKTVREYITPIPYRVQRFFLTTSGTSDKIKTDSEILIEIFEEHKRNAEKFPKKPYVPFIPQPSKPWWEKPKNWNRNCPECGLDLSGPLGYVCPNFRCPVGLGGTTCQFLKSDVTSAEE